MYQRFRLTAAIILIGLLVTASLADWRKIETGSLSWLHAIQFVDPERGWAGGSNGTLLSTIDGGVMWKKSKVPMTDTIRDIFFRDRLGGWLLVERDRFQQTGANRSYLLRTVDGGNKWSTVEFPDSSERFVRMVFTPSGHGVVIGEGGSVGSIPSLGSVEAWAALPEKYLMLAGASFEPGKLLLVGGAGSIFWTEDDGKAWNFAKFSGAAPTGKFNAVHFVGRMNGWVAGNGGSVFATIDGGKTWERQALPSKADIYDIRFTDKELGFAVGESGIILRTLDSGRTWMQVNSGLKHRLERLAFSGDRVFAVGFGGAFVTAGLADERLSKSLNVKR